MRIALAVLELALHGAVVEQMADLPTLDAACASAAAALTTLSGPP